MRENVGAGVVRHGHRPRRVAGPQGVAGAPDRLEPHAGARHGQLAPQPAGVHVDDVGERVELIVPGVVEDALAAEDLARVPEEQLEQPELLGAQGQRFSGEARFARRRVEREAAERQLRRQRAPRPPQQRADARQQLLEREGLDEVVVGAAVQAGDLVGGRVPRREHEHRDGEPPVAQLAAQGEPVDLREHDVQDQEVVGELVLRVAGVGGAAPHREAAARGASVVQHVNGVALGLESRLERPGQLLRIFDDQDPHARLGLLRWT